MDFNGNFVALITPFRDGKLDFDSLAGLIERQIAAGVSGLVPCGTTGESPTLTHEEHNQVVAETVRIADGRVPVIAGTGSNSTAEAISMTRHAEEAGAAAALIVAPYYNKPTQDGLYHHYWTLAESTGLPLIVYNIPGRCGVEISTATLLRLAKHPRIASVKEATGNLLHVTELTSQTDLAVLSGDDPLTIGMMAMGACGVVSVISNLLPEQMSKLVGHALAGDFAAAREIHDKIFPLMQATMALATNPIPIKTAVALRGLCSDELRLPLYPMSDDARAVLEALVREAPEQ